MLYQYKARRLSGDLLTGELEGDNVLLVKEALASQGLFPVSVQPKGFELSLKTLLAGKLKAKELAAFTRQFQVMFAAGMPMEKILLTLKVQTAHPGLRGAVAKIHEDVSGGMRLRDAFARHPKYFNELYTNMLAIGEIGGVLDKTLKGIAEILVKENQIKTKVKSATLYPKIVFVVTVFVAILMLIFVVPVFSGFYSGHGAKLPLPTLILVSLSEWVIGYWYFFVAATAGAVFSWKRFSKTERGKRFVGKLQLKLPVFGNLYRLSVNARFGHLLSSLYRVGLPLSRSLEVTATTIENVIYADGVRQIKQEVERGRSLS
ncbi:MAG: type II secretion system F family protein, partial [Deltaproteobacteria bacterium]|nr:type II secretion system F family protein [Deltaproteobacteria bacterium]